MRKVMNQGWCLHPLADLLSYSCKQDMYVYSKRSCEVRVFPLLQGFGDVLRNFALPWGYFSAMYVGLQQTYGASGG